MISIPDAWAPMLLQSVRDAVLYHEGLLRSATIRDRADYEDYHLQLPQFLSYVKEEYRAVEGEIGVLLEQLHV
ncbi:hypothetical protein SAMN05216359_102366 [Roseateles sp. YR242]|uniref:hypothetical protein n=1 Tax=Roseateles sp. YR242 TaxID=1855305 RepID=UPI0008C9A472|nr:hypothetical protein [Roseateles sp. YR242]SEK60575.1 hypothetical protein SAMN05216359_102366 [Roseateles sp. YR242]